MTAQPSAQPYAFDISPVLKLYLEPIELIKKNYEAFIRNANEIQSTFGANGLAGGKSGQATHPVEGAASAYDAALLNWQKSSGDLFKRFVQNQIEICRFFGNRWEQYLKLPDQVSTCRSIKELGNVQAAFLNQVANDYVRGTEKLSQPVAEAVSNLAGKNGYGPQKAAPEAMQ
jgi:hypothetical protein